MKKIILGVIVLAAGYALSAQVTVTNKEQSTTPATTYTVPEPILTNFQTTYPGATMVTWQPTTEWWYATYTTNNNRIVHVYYNTQPYYLEKGRDVNYIVALPVINTYVPEGVITAAINSYRANLYSITTMKGTNNEVVYQVCLIENGTARTVWMNAGTIVFIDVDKIRVNNDK